MDHYASETLEAVVCSKTDLGAHLTRNQMERVQTFVAEEKRGRLIIKVIIIKSTGCEDPYLALLVAKRSLMWPLERPTNGRALCKFQP